jgi:hypothetical protein
MTYQLELFPSIAQVERHELAPYWREKLERWPRDVFEWRHHRDTTAWSMATGGYGFAILLFTAGAMPRRELKRWWRLNRRVMRWDQIVMGPP